MGYGGYSSQPMDQHSAYGGASYGSMGMMGANAFQGGMPMGQYVSYSMRRVSMHCTDMNLCIAIICSVMMDLTFSFLHVFYFWKSAPTNHRMGAARKWIRHQRSNHHQDLLPLEDIMPAVGMAAFHLIRVTGVIKDKHRMSIDNATSQ